MRAAFTRTGEAGSDRTSLSEPAAQAPDLHTQLEDLFHEVWRDEADWTMNDRIDLSLGPSGAR